MRTRHIAFTGLNEVVCETVEQELTAPESGALVQLSYTCISAGTEIAKLTGLQPGNFPVGPLCNRAVGRVIEAGAKRDDLQPGDFVFCHGPHASHAALAGVKALLVDPVAGRLAIARQCGVEHAIEADGAAEQVMALTGGQGADYILECTGVPAVVEGAVQFAGRSAQLIMIGSPRGELQPDLTAFLNHFHLWRPQGDLTLKGAHEWTNSALSRVGQQTQYGAPRAHPGRSDIG